MAGQRLTDKTALTEQTGSGDLYMGVDVSDSSGSAAGTSKKIDSQYVIQTDKFSLSNADVLALDTAPKTLIGALSGYMPTIYNVTVLCTYATATEVSSNNLNFGYIDTDDLAYWRQIRDCMNGKTTDLTYQLAADPSSAGTCTESILNKPFKMWATGSGFSGGWSCDVYVTYAYTKLL